jgi:hypothetical protein
MTHLVTITVFILLASGPGTLRTSAPGAVAASGQEAAASGTGDLAKERALVEQTIRASIGWALTKDRPLAERVIAHDADLFMFNPDSKSTTVGWEAFVKNFTFWMDPRFKATSFDVRELQDRPGNGNADIHWVDAALVTSRRAKAVFGAPKGP